MPECAKMKQEQQQWCLIGLIILTSGLLLLSSSNKSLKVGPLPQLLEGAASTSGYPEWFDLVLRQTGQRRLKIGLVKTELQGGGQSGIPEELSEMVKVEYERVDPGLEWAHLFPERIDERRAECPEIPMPDFGGFRGLDVVVATMACNTSQGTRDVQTLQDNLVVATLAAGSRASWPGQLPVYVVFLGGCEPMLEIFRCDDLIWNKRSEEAAMVYRPDLAKLKHKVLMPVGTCQLARPYNVIFQHSGDVGALRKEAYVSMVHSSEQYVCGAIALAQSILKTNTSRELVLLADASISGSAIRGLSDAGWKVKRIKRIRNPNAKPGAYNEWNYSKLRVWQLTDYHKVIFIDADFIVRRNLDSFFSYPQLSAVSNSRQLFNSGIMVAEPSLCFFRRMMRDRFLINSYNGGDQGFLNEVFPWWHRLTGKLNYFKYFPSPTRSREVPDDILTIHFFGIKPWWCYKDYDCNWDVSSLNIYASDDAHRRWWDVYDAMPKRLQPFCAMTRETDAMIRTWRETAAQDKYENGRWKIIVRDPRQHYIA